MIRFRTELALLSRMFARRAPVLPSDPATAPITFDMPPQRVLDPKALAEILALEVPGQPSLLTEMMDAFHAASDAYLVRLRSALRSGDAASVLDAAHALKGAAASLGAERVRASALELEIAAREPSLVGAEERLAVLEIACEQALAALSEEAGRGA